MIRLSFIFFFSDCRKLVMSEERNIHHFQYNMARHGEIRHIGASGWRPYFLLLIFLLFQHLRSERSRTHISIQTFSPDLD